MDPNTVVIIPLVGGPANGSVVVTVIGPDGRPPLTHWLIGEGGLSDAPIYELESCDESPPWRYTYRLCLADPRACGTPSGSDALSSGELSSAAAPATRT
jgi:hypothetical protein